MHAAGGIAGPDKKDIVIGEQCDRTGPTQLVDSPHLKPGAPRR